MPEFPEIYSMAENIKKSEKVLGTRISKIIINAKDHLTLSENLDLDNLIGAKIKDVTAIGKHLVMTVKKDGILYYLDFHFRLTGELILRGTYAEHRHSNMFQIFLGERFRLDVDDTGYFSQLNITTNIEDVTGKLGVNPLDDTSFTAEYLFEKTQKSRQRIKNLLTDQSIIAGIGNLYSDEILFSASVFPHTPANQLDFDAIQRIVYNAKFIFHKSINAGGVAKFAGRQVGRYQNHLFVHGLAGEPCRKCGTLIEKTKSGSRGTFYCPRCQKQNN